MIQQQIMERQAALEKAKAENRIVVSSMLQPKTIVTSGSLPQLNTKTRVKTQQASRQAVDKKISLTESVKSQQEKSLPKVASSGESDFPTENQQTSSVNVGENVSVVIEQESVDTDGENTIKRRKDAGKDKQLALLPKGPRQRSHLQNLDGTDMSVQQYLEMVRGIKRGESTQILNFGLANSKWTTLKESEVTEKPVKKRNFMFEIENAKRLLPSTC